MSFRIFYRDVCIKEPVPSAPKICDINEGLLDNNQWWTLEKPYLVRDNTYHVPTIFSVGRTTIPAKNLTNENRAEIMNYMHTKFYLKKKKFLLIECYLHER